MCYYLYLSIYIYFQHVYGVYYISYIKTKEGIKKKSFKSNNIPIPTLYYIYDIRYSKWKYIESVSLNLIHNDYTLYTSLKQHKNKI